MDLSTDTAVCDDQIEANNYPVEFLNSSTHSGKPSHRLNLVEGVIVKVLRNLDIKKGLCNGARLILRHLHSHVLNAEILTGASNETKVFIAIYSAANSISNSSVLFHDDQQILRTDIW